MPPKCKSIKNRGILCDDYTAVAVSQFTKVWELQLVEATDGRKTVDGRATGDGERRRTEPPVPTMVSVTRRLEINADSEKKIDREVA